MKRTAVAIILAVLASSCACTSQSHDVSMRDIRKLNDRQSMLQLEYLGRKVEQDLGQKEAEEYAKRVIDEVVESKQKDITVEYVMAQDGYWCTPEERKELAKEQMRQEQTELWGPPAAVLDMRPGLFGGAFAGDVEYHIDSEHTGYWMNISKNKELKVSTTADSEAELLELARTIKEKESEGFDFTRMEYFGGKKDLAQQAYSINGTVCILNSKDGLKLFGDQHLLGSAYEQARDDLKHDDGIIFLGSQE